MRIDNFGRPPVDPLSAPVKRPGPANRASSWMQNPSEDALFRAKRIESLKQQLASGKPINAKELANKLLDSGLFFDEKV